MAVVKNSQCCVEETEKVSHSNEEINNTASSNILQFSTLEMKHTEIILSKDISKKWSKCL